MWQFLAPLLVGARVRIYHDEVVGDPTALLQVLEADSVTVAGETVPSILRAMLAEMAVEALPALRWMLATGEALPPETCRAWKQSVGDHIRCQRVWANRMLR